MVFRYHPTKCVERPGGARFLRPDRSCQFRSGPAPPLGIALKSFRSGPAGPDSCCGLGPTGLRACGQYGPYGPAYGPTGLITGLRAYLRAYGPTGYGPTYGLRARGLRAYGPRFPTFCCVFVDLVVIFPSGKEIPLRKSSEPAKKQQNGQKGQKGGGIGQKGAGRAKGAKPY